MTARLEVLLSVLLALALTMVCAATVGAAPTPAVAGGSLLQLRGAQKLRQRLRNPTPRKAAAPVSGRAPVSTPAIATVALVQTRTAANAGTSVGGAAATVASVGAKAGAGWSGWDPEHPVKSLQPPWAAMPDVGDFDLPAPPDHMHPPPPPPVYWDGMVHGDSTQGGGAEEGWGLLYGFEEDRYIPPPPPPPPHVPPPIPPPPPKGPDAGGDNFVERAAHASAAAAGAADFVNPFDAASPLAHAPAPADARDAVLARVKASYTPLFGPAGRRAVPTPASPMAGAQKADATAAAAAADGDAHSAFNADIGDDLRLWSPPVDTRTAGGATPFAREPPRGAAAPAPAAAPAAPPAPAPAQWIPPHMRSGAAPATAGAGTSVGPKFDAALKPALGAAAAKL